MRRNSVLSVFITATLAMGCLLGGLTGCSGQDAQKGAQGQGDAANTVRIGTMPTEDILPLWVAENEGLFEEAGVSAQIITFDSAQALSAAITAGEVDMAMVDIMRAVKLCEAGAPVVLEWVTLGTDASQGRFGVMAPADAPYSTLRELAQQAQEDPDSLAAKGVGVAANTVPEYVFDRLCELSGLQEGEVPTQEVASLPERYSLMASGKLAGAALPGSLLALGEANGMKLLADDTYTATFATVDFASDPATDSAMNLSQSVMVATESFAAENLAVVKKVAEVWDVAAKQINDTPTAYIGLLSGKANLNETIADIYPVSTYPMALLSDGQLAHPDSAYVTQQIEWMHEKGYSSHSITYDEATGELIVDA